MPVLGASADQKLIEAAVRRYFDARSRLDFVGIQSVYPGATDGERTQLRVIDRGCKAYSEEPLRIDILRHDGLTASVEAQVRSYCHQRVGKQAPPLRVDITMKLEKKAGDTYRITQVNRPDQIR